MLSHTVPGAWYGRWLFEVFFDQLWPAQEFKMHRVFKAVPTEPIETVFFELPDEADGHDHPLPWMFQVFAFAQSVVSPAGHTFAAGVFAWIQIDGNAVDMV